VIRAVCRLKPKKLAGKIAEKLPGTHQSSLRLKTYPELFQTKRQKTPEDFT